MSVKIQKYEIPWAEGKTNALLFVPSNDFPPVNTLGVFAHGYTSHKGDLINWATRLSDDGMGTIIFDLPGHYIGSYNEVKDCEQFKTQVPQIFVRAYKELQKQMIDHFSGRETEFSDDKVKLVLGGHSLGSFFSLLALNTMELMPVKKIAVCAGLGMGPKSGQHFFQSEFFKKTLNIRRQLVSPAIGPEVIFPWLHESKENLKLSGQEIYLVTGKDDVVVPSDGLIRMKEHLEKQDNSVTIIQPNKLPHDQPGMAGTHIRKILKDKDLLRS